MNLLILLGTDVRQVTSLHAVTVRENELSLVSPSKVMGTSGMTSLGETMRKSALLTLKV